MPGLRERLRGLDQEFFREPTANERRRLRVILAVFAATMVVLLAVQLRDGVSFDDLSGNWPRLLLPGLIPIAGALAMRWARR